MKHSTGWLLGCVLSTAALAGSAQADFSLTVFHNNDGESALLPIDVDGGIYGGAARFASVLERERLADTSDGFLTLSSGDNFLAGAVWSAGLSTGQPFDAQVLAALQYDALTLGNHDFDFGPDALAGFIGDYQAAGGTAPFLSASLDFSSEYGLQNLVNSGAIKQHHVVNVGGEQVGIIGITTPDITFISNPGQVTINPNIAQVIGQQVQQLESMGVNKIILSSHLQSINNEIALSASLSGIDAIVAGGGDELLAKPSDLLIPGDMRQSDYPRADHGVPVVTTAGQYKYLGELNLVFDDAGQVTQHSGTMHRVADSSVGADGVGTHTAIDPIIEQIQTVFDSATVVGTTEVTLDGIRENLRTRETNFGNLIADAMLDAGQKGAAGTATNNPTIGFTNAGGIRNSVVIAEDGDITDLLTKTALPFGNQVSVLQDVPVQTLLLTLEHSVASVENVSGQFLQIAGLSFTYDPNGTAQTLVFDEGNNPIGFGEEGDRVLEIVLADGTLIVKDGQIVAGFEDLTFDISTNNFVAGGGDGYFFLDDVAFNRVDLDVAYDDALEQFVSQTLGGVVPETLYGPVSMGRIVAVPEPSVGVLALAGLGILARRRRKA